MRHHIICVSAALAVATAAVPASAAITVFGSPLTPEVPGATGAGTVRVTYDSDLRTLAIATNWAGLSGGTTVAHIHCCVAPPGTVGIAVTPNTLPAFPTGVRSGSYSITLDLSQTGTFTSGFLGANGGTTASAEAALLNGMRNGRAYFNIHSSTFGGGEIRGFLAPVPEPGTWALLIAGFGLVGSALRRQQRRAVKPVRILA